MALGNLVEFAKAAGYIKEIPFSGGFYEEITPVHKPNFWEPPKHIPPFMLPSLPKQSSESDPNGRKPNEPGAKLDSGKIRPWLMFAGFSRALEEVARVTTKGAEKYTENGWCEVPDGINRYMEAFGRHLIELGKGKVFDDGPGGLGPDIYHKAQLAWNALASLELELREKNDNN